MGTIDDPTGGCQSNREYCLVERVFLVLRAPGEVKNGEEDSAIYEKRIGNNLVSQMKTELLSKAILTVDQTKGNVFFQYMTSGFSTVSYLFI